MGLQSLDLNKSLAQLLALNALFDAARAGDAGRIAAGSVQLASDVLASQAADESLSDTFFHDCYTALMGGAPTGSKLS